MLLNLEEISLEYFNCFAPLADRYDAFLVDIWGVLHDSAQPYPGAVDCLKQLKANQKQIILLSNASRRSSVLAGELIPFGITDRYYDQIVSSGELVWNAFADQQDERIKNLGNRYYLLGSESYGVADGLSLMRTEDLKDADFVLNIGVIGNPSTTDREEPVLQEASQRKLTMVCANPDLEVVRDGVLGIAAGTVARRYEGLGGQVIYFGKPHQDVYRSCFNLLSGIDKKRIAAVGDALFTDISGAVKNSIDSILVATGIHSEILQGLPDQTEPCLKLFRQEKQFPTHIVKGFRW